MIAKGKRFFGDRIYRSVTALCASFLVVFACYFVYTGVLKIITMI